MKTVRQTAGKGRWQKASASSDHQTRQTRQTQDLVGDQTGDSGEATHLPKLRHDFPMFDDDVLRKQLQESAYHLGKAKQSLSKLETTKGVKLVPADIPVQQAPVTPVPRGEPARLIANVIARTDHPNMPLYCFIAMITRSAQSEKYCPGSIVRPIPVDRFRLLGDEKGHFWLKKRRVPDIGDIVEIRFFEEDTSEYISSAHGNSPHQNEDLLCTTLTLRHRCDLEKNDFLTSTLMSMAVDDIQKKWPWKRALGKFESVTPGKKIWFVHPKQSLKSVIILRLKRPSEVSFKYRGASNDRISVDFPAAYKRILRDIPVTAAGFNATPPELNSWFSEQCDRAEQLFVLGLARVECQCPLGVNRLEELPDRLRRHVDVEMLPKYCQILLIGVLPCPKGRQDHVPFKHATRTVAKLPVQARKDTGKTNPSTRDRARGIASGSFEPEFVRTTGPPPLAPLESRLRRRGKHGPRHTAAGNEP